MVIKRELLERVIYACLFILGIYVFVNYILELIAPFIFAWLLGGMLDPCVTFFETKLKMSRGFATIISMLTVLTGFFGLIFQLSQMLYSQILSLKDSYPAYKLQIVEMIDIIEIYMGKVGSIFNLPTDMATLDNLINEILNYIGNSLNELAPYLYDILGAVPTSLFFILITLLSTFFMTKDRQEIKKFIIAQLSISMLKKIALVKLGLKNALGGYIKTQLILMCIVFSICLVGLFCLRREHFLLVSLIIAIFDALPALGSGAILITWGIYHLIMGNYSVSIGLFGIYGLLLITRQVVEPRVLSGQIGVYALVTIISIYIGLKLIGPLGIIIGPITAVTIKTLQDIGVIPQFKQINKFQ
ncbi:sporulation integral membrane protein YtvI [Candidatus Epulonipiscium fishelsonii]|uniref:Sporulation integral membrane protein YtvI n=1 Tax=Candidatus Epulonipiscium fishelsonii TaxID=77094 RepID=A0ACC8XJ79_9FIRM|nr:sporulation integral membrane protein YtvI [Epulopiscium sp. SCG-D08WGA-EpuloA1]OON96536.1 MAG: sporulation integral membrane protein YtvI [Epulopiscium sp. AS2M-Bin002]